MAYDSREIANQIVQWHWSRDRGITHLSVQKILFFCHGSYLAETGLELVAEPFEAWQNGPVVRAVFDAFRSYKDQPIRELARRYDPVRDVHLDIELTLKGADLEIVDREISYYSQFSPFELVTQTHIKGGPWDIIWNKKNFETAILGMRIPNDIIKSHFLGLGTIKN